MLAKFLVFFLIWLPNESASCKQRDFDTLILVVCIFIKKINTIKCHQWRIRARPWAKEEGGKGGGGEVIWFFFPCRLFFLLCFNFAFFYPNKGRTPGSCVLKSSAIEGRSILSIDILYRHLSHYSIDIPINTRLILYQHYQSVDSRPSVHESIEKLIDSVPKCRWSDDRVSMEGRWTFFCGCFKL